MPGKEKTTEDIPEMAREKLPPHAQEIYMKAHNSALEEYQDPSKRRGGTSESAEEVAHKVAWAAVKKEYEKSENGDWVKNLRKRGRRNKAIEKQLFDDYLLEL